ncbi:MAG: rhomboid family intramembrane serine protease [Pseudodesulfovibrio sp.]|uniref:Rhomboid family protein n=1 Tax=Pseudodesulfovibrio aespoeensis (strain ATCC 700646 / DSM 10631 / Aspo-2) TaxID=643562 RepID=E6VWQ7_PSEA9|nr:MULTISPECIES: rhomboid family intramembrane serine protease [Pseudodesulfovibrio]MBU4192991.1 rhomboid family intramembrane serine protease [Pseudomonadota bacterium]ADU63669.1 Rhomboid family protein [Pseudodesulfovibrio aespoeensis Aspo-2]MBU4244952.1 rhomboid family intramembrane serine protease [Pseudomonadota bacterium]MBU4378058.1 rhomboid family intramembrane serine protease [Pseudomonadota bacterium]MBU4475555.1 rhomboid family intramembrane serine protease [Pseudomonadota bacterium
MHSDATPQSFLRRTLRPSWTDLAPVILGEDAPALDGATAGLWSLVLSSRHIPHRQRRRLPGEGGGHSVQVQLWFVERAAAEIRLYLEENAPGRHGVHLPDLRPVSGYEPTVAVMALLLLFFWAYTRTYPGWGLYPTLWVGLGSADAGRILGGEWWRLFTALTLHGDGAHVLGNATIGGIFVWLASRRLGAGLAWLLTFLAGGLGNLLNSLALAAPHNAIGFSTATFGAAGVLAAIAPFAVGGGMHGLGVRERGSGLARRFARFVRSSLVPVAAGLGLLAMLGVGENTDLGAHLFGFVAGLSLGLVAGLAASRTGLPGPRADAALYLAALALPGAAWGFAWLA